jgi:phenylpropionate dioxygenase-like ring-hydroxylating dioxygenase large terminal subunit
LAASIVVPGLPSGTAQATLPWSWYSDPRVLSQEQERIFRRAWQYAAPAEHVENPGDYVTCRVGDIPVVLVRGRDRRLRAFLNVCRHRGSILAEGSGNRETLQCRYHAWTYDLDGRLRAAPRSQREPGFEIEGIRLLELRVETWGPFVFVTADPAATELADTLGPVADLIAAGGVDVQTLRFRRRSEFELACNWKIAVENYLECYHCQVAHPGFSAVVDVTPDAYRLETHARSSSQFGPLRRGDSEPRGSVVEGQFHWLWPVTKVYALPGPANLAVGPLVPLAPGRTAGWLDYFFPEDVPESDVEELLAFDDQVGREDRGLVESVQLGVGSGLLETGRLLPESERLLAHFQGLVREALA